MKRFFSRRDMATACMLGVLIALCLWTAYGLQKRQARGASSAEPSETGDTLQPRVNTAELAEAPLEIAFTRRGVLTPLEQVSVYSEVTATVIKRHVSVGSRVSKGDVIVELDGTLLKIRLDEAKARLKSAEVQLEATETELQDTEEWDDEDLVRDAKLRHDIALAAFDLAETQTDEAEAIYNSRIVRTPIDGTIAQCWVEAGEFAASGQPVAEIVVTERLKAVVPLTARETLALEGNVRCRTGFEGPESAMQSAKILSIAPMADPRTRLFSVEIEVNNKDDTLQAGLHVDMTFQAVAAEPYLVLPRKAVTRQDDSLVCYRIEEEAGVHVVRLVEPVLESIPGRPKVLRVVSGLSAGDEVVVGSLIFLENGLAVRPARLERR